MDNREIWELFSEWRHDGIEHLSAIKGHAGVLSEILGDLNAEQQKSVRAITNVCKRGVHNWQTRTVYMEARYQPERIHWEAVSLSKSINEAVGHLCQEFEIDTIEVVVPEKLPPVRSNCHLSAAILGFIYPEPYFVSYLRDYPPTIWVAPPGDDSIVIQIHNGQRSEPHGSDVRLARFLVEQHGSQVEATHSDDGTEYRFALPLWGARAIGENP